METDIITTYNNTRNEVWLSETKDLPENEKFEEETLEEKHPLENKSRINYLYKQEKYILILVDTLLSTTAIGPLVIGFWRGTWGLLDFHGDMFPFWLCFTFGIVTHMMFAFVKHLLYEFVNENKIRSKLHRIICQCLRVTYTYIFGLMCILHWRGGWILLDEYLHIGELWITASLTTTFLGALMLLRCIRTLLAPPFFVAIDSYRHLFLFPSLCKRNTRDWSLYLLDCAFSVGVVGTLVVFVWRGVWILFDLYLLPEDRKYSALGSLAIGYVIVVVTFSLQPLMRYICARLEGLARLIAADVFLLLSFLGTVNVWRGIWNLLDLWLLPNNLVLSCWITHVGCFVFLVLLNCSNSILVRGVYIDAEEEEGKCVVFPCHYLRLFFKIEREKKEARRQNLLSAPKDFASCTDGTGKDAENGALLQNSTPTTIIPGNPESLV